MHGVRDIFDFLARVLGLDNLSGPWYGFWSGFGSDLTEFALLGVVIKALMHFNCAEKGCWRVGKHSVGGTKYRTCHVHATIAHHSRLHADHARKHPDQHELLNRPPEAPTRPATATKPRATHKGPQTATGRKAAQE
jgi:hypothetical protein